MQPKVLERSRPRVSILDYSPTKITSFLREKLAAKGVREAYAFGSFAMGACTPWSDLDLVVVLQTDCPFIERPREFADIYELGIPIDLLVYTPQELAHLRESGSSFWRAFEQQKIRII